MKILGFDSWTRGSHHYARLTEAFVRRGMTLQLVHLGSWGNDMGRPPTETIGSLPTRDISSYKGGSLEVVLDEEKPDAVILLSTMTFAHRAFIRYCRMRRIPTLNLYHGMTTTWFDLAEKTGFQASAAGHAMFVLKRFYKTFRYTLPCYVTALVRTKAAAWEWRRFLQDLVAMFAGRFIMIASEDARTDACAVYTQSEIDHAVYTYGFAHNAIHVVGNPDLVRFALAERYIGSRLRGEQARRGAIMYIDTALQANAMVFPDVAMFAAHLRDAARAVQSCGFEFMARLHPANDVARIREILRDVGVELIEERNFVEKLLECEAAIVETTTLAMVPALIGMPVFFANFGALGALRFGSALTSYPRGRSLRDLVDLSGYLLESAKIGDGRAVQQWIERSTGPLPAELMPDRVAELVERLVHRTPPVEGAVAHIESRALGRSTASSG